MDEIKASSTQHERYWASRTADSTFPAAKPHRSSRRTPEKTEGYESTTRRASRETRDVYSSGSETDRTDEDAWEAWRQSRENYGPEVSSQQKVDVPYMQRSRPLAESTLRSKPPKTRTRELVEPKRPSILQRVEPKRPSILQRLFSSPKHPKKVSFMDDHDHEYKSRGSSATQKASLRPTSSNSTSQERLKHERASHRRGSGAKPDQSTHGAGNRAKDDLSRTREALNRAYKDAFVDQSLQHSNGTKEFERAHKAHIRACMDAKPPRNSKKDEDDRARKALNRAFEKAFKNRNPQVSKSEEVFRRAYEDHNRAIRDAFADRDPQDSKRGETLKIAREALDRAYEDAFVKRDPEGSKRYYRPKSIEAPFDIMSTPDAYAEPPPHPPAEAWSASREENLGAKTEHQSDLGMSGPGSSEENTALPSSRTATSHEVNVDKKESIATSGSSSEVRALVDIPEQEEVEFRSPVRKSVLPRKADVHATTFGWTEDHLVLGPTDEDILVATNPLGHGSLGVVEEVRRIDGEYPTLVRKRVELPLPKKKAAAYLKIVQEEARILRSLVHPHIVTLIGSYEDMKQSIRPSYCLLMSPVGESDLEAFLTVVGEHDVASESSVRSRHCIRNWMACLASALQYMHASGVRHQDIKPSNIIHKGEHVFFTDFSSSSSFKIGHTTSTENPARSTPMYGAPEVTSDCGKHGRSTDIFSLGCVFSDMLSVLEGRTVLGFHDYLRNDGNAAATDTKHVPRALSYSEKIPVIRDWFKDSHCFGTHVSQMLHPDRKIRPTATEVLQALILNEVCDAGCSCLRAEFLQRELYTISVVSVD